MIYLAAPYSHSDPAVVEARMLVFSHHMAKMIENGQFPVSPLMNHFLIQTVETSFPRDWEFWQGYSTAMLTHCREMVVLKIEGWSSSAGVTAEIAIASEMGIPISYREVD